MKLPKLTEEYMREHTFFIHVKSETDECDIEHKINFDIPIRIPNEYDNFDILSVTVCRTVIAYDMVKNIVHTYATVKLTTDKSTKADEYAASAVEETFIIPNNAAEEFLREYYELYSNKIKNPLAYVSLSDFIPATLKLYNRICEINYSESLDAV